MNILFVCTGNTCRSPMAEGIMNSLAKEKDLDIRATSGGIFALNGGEIANNSIEALKEIDIDISQNKSKIIDRELVDKADIILTMSEGHKENLRLNFSDANEKIFLLNEYAFNIEKDIGDPYGGNLFEYKITRDEIYKAIEAIINNLDK